jgi:hypothetical protein
MWTFPSKISQDAEHESFFIVKIFPCDNYYHGYRVETNDMPLGHEENCPNN